MKDDIFLKFNHKIAFQILFYFLGVVFTGFGIQLIIYTNVGTAPLDALNYYLARIYHQVIKNNDFSTLKSTIGISSMIIGTLSVIILYAITKKKGLILTWLNIFITSLVISAWGLLFNTFAPLDVPFIIRFLIFLLGLIIVSIGIVIVVATKFPAATTEEFMKLIDKKIHNLFVSKLIIGGIYLVLAIIAMIVSIVIIDGNKPEFTQISVFTIVNLLTTSFFVFLFDKLYQTLLFKRKTENIFTEPDSNSDK